MNSHNLYSKRNKPLPDVYEYDVIPVKLKNQIYHIWDRFFDEKNFKDHNYSFDNHKSWWQGIYKILLEEEGLKVLISDEFERYNTTREIIDFYFEKLSDVNKLLDVVQLIFQLIQPFEKFYNDRYQPRLKYNSDKAIEVLNHRFKENGIGFQFISNQIIKVDNEVLHNEIIVPTLEFLRDPVYTNANEEYLKAFDHYRFKRNGECLNECLKAFESTLKIICTQNSWAYDDSDTSKKLINVVLEKRLIPSYFQSKFHSLKTLLESSVPTIRNKNSGHGQGVKKVNINESMTSYMLNITGSTIKFLVEQNIKLKK